MYYVMYAIKLLHGLEWCYWDIKAFGPDLGLFGPVKAQLEDPFSFSSAVRV